jgi:hypothetical protein
MDGGHSLLTTYRNLLLVKRKDPLTRKELFEYLSNRVCEITYTPSGSTRKNVRVTLLHEYIRELDNYPIGFKSIFETAMFEPHAVTCLDIDANQWVTIPVGNILHFYVP